MAAPVLQFEKPEYEYQTSEVVMLPYAEKHGQVWPEDFLGRLYFRLKDEDLLPMIFPGMDVGHLNRFMAYMASHSQTLLVCCRKTETNPVPVGIGWITESDGRDGARKAAFGFGYFREMWANRGLQGARNHVALSMMMLHWWFTVLDINILYGTTLNPLAKNYANRFGFKYLCELPKFFICNGGLVNGHLICLDRDVFLDRYRRWKG